MSKSAQRDDHWSSLHDKVNFRYDEQRPPLHGEGLRTVWYGLCLGHTWASVVIVAAIPTMLCHDQPKEKHYVQFIESKVITASIVENCYHKYRFNQANQQKEWPHM
jgi:hypothetical protein